MGNSPGFSVRSVHIDACPSDDVAGEGWRRAVIDAPWLTDEHRRKFEDLHPAATHPQRTILRRNHEAWDSMSSYMAEMAQDEDARRIMAGMTNGSIALTRRSQYAAEEVLEGARPVTLFIWERPLVRLGSHIVAEIDQQIGEDEMGAMDVEFGGVVLTRSDDRVLSFLTSGIQPYVAQRLDAILTPEHGPRSTWRVPITTRTTKLPQEGENE